MGLGLEKAFAKIAKGLFQFDLMWLRDGLALVQGGFGVGLGWAKHKTTDKMTLQ